MILLETLKSTLTRQLIIDVSPQHIDDKFVDFFNTNAIKYPGKTSLKFNIVDTLNQKRLTMKTMEMGITMNDDMIEFINKNKHIEVSVKFHDNLT